MVVSARSAVVFALRVSLVFGCLLVCGLVLRVPLFPGCGARRAARAGFALPFLLLERAGLARLKLPASASRACGERVSLRLV